ncbi:amidohydrolase family protein [Oscillibacter hominis]|uniref:Amidohydrolase family protein n=1 Tax=Oscillibacter hominis TaxID=2763056 RepID=A0A7G9B1S0_9FIRM|nr:amidohydrolase family protein [Oscillibacter hominis]QNL43501.1 amidohydrolase family protein [Oscillibacter hominis]
MNNNLFALKGAIIHTPDPKRFTIVDDGYLVCQNGLVQGVYEKLPEEFQGIPVRDYTGKLIIPGMADMHIHAPQYGFRGLGMDLDLDSVWNTWFETYSLPEESHYADLGYADMAYEKFVGDLLKTTTTRLCIFGTIHRPATELLMDKLAEKGFAAYVGKLNMDRNSIEGLQETTEESLSETRKWLEETVNRHPYVKPMVTPRYTPSCTDACMEGLQKLVEEFNVPVQSHLSEGLDEIEWVKELKPEIEFYGQAYDMYGMLGGGVPTVMAHCVYPTDAEFEMMSQRKNLWVAHCPQSNLHSSGSGAPIRRYLEAGVHVGIGCDMAGANTLNLFRAIADATTASKVYWAANERRGDPFAQKTYLSLSEAFYIATKGGASFWGKAGSFEEGSLFDAVVIDDSSLADFNQRSVRQRLERVIQQSDDRHVAAKFINGRQVL